MNQKGFTLFLVSIFILIPLVFLSLGYLISIKNSQKNVPNVLNKNLITLNTSFNKKCKEYAILDKNSYLKSYIVKPGDTLINLAKTYLGSTGRLNEIVTLNEQSYSNLRFNYNLEKGWILYFPPEFSFPSSGSISGHSGEITNEGDNNWEFRTVNIDSDPLDYKLYKDLETKYFGKETFHIGDCVRVIFDAVDNKVIAISTQEPGINYFKQ